MEINTKDAVRIEIGIALALWGILLIILPPVVFVVLGIVLSLIVCYLTALLARMYIEDRVDYDQ